MKDIDQDIISKPPGSIETIHQTIPLPVLPSGDQPDEHYIPTAQMSMLVMLFHIFKNGMIGSFTLISSYAKITAEQAFIANLARSEIYTAAKGNALVPGYILMLPIQAFNTGLLISVSRCLGLEDYQGIRHQIKMHFWFMAVFSLVMIIFSCAYAFVIEWVYADEVLYWTRIEIAFTILMFIVYIYNDSYRNLYIAFDQKGMSVLFECVTQVQFVVASIVFGYSYGYGIWGVEISAFVSLFALYLQYHFYFKLGSGFKNLRAKLDDICASEDKNDIHKGAIDPNDEEKQPIIDNKIDTKKHEEDKEGEAKEDKEGKAQEDKEGEAQEDLLKAKKQKADLLTYKEYFWFGLYFASQGIADVIMMTVNRLFASMLLNKYAFSSVAITLAVNDMFYGLALGYAAVVGSDLSILMVNKIFAPTKKYMIASIIIIFAYTILSVIVLIAFKQEIAELLISNHISQQILVDNMISFAFFEFWLILCFSLYGICRGIGREKVLANVMIFCCIVINFGAQLILIFCIKVLNSAFFWAMGTCCLCISIGEFVIIWRTDLEKEADAMIKKVTTLQEL